MAYDRFLVFNIGESELKEELVNMDIPTNDDLSSLILRSYYRHLINQKINAETKIKKIQNYYFKQTSLKLVF
jgi:hypothetical protein